MKVYTVKRVYYALRFYGFQHAGKGNGSGHEEWVDMLGRKCRPMMRKKDVPHANVYSLGDELATQGVCTRAEFVSRVKTTL